MFVQSHLSVLLPPTGCDVLQTPPHPHAGGFWRRRWVQNVLPFVTSVSVHAALVALGFVTYSVVTVVQSKAHVDQVIIPSAVLVDHITPDAMPNLDNLGNDLNRLTMLEQNAGGDVDRQWIDKHEPTPAKPLGGTGDDAALLDGGPLSASSFSNPARFHSQSERDGAGPLGRMGLPGGVGVGPHGPMFTNGGNAFQIIFLCDGTGSMLNKMPTLKDQLAAVVNQLKPPQSYDILFFQDSQVIKFADALSVATPESKRRAGAFLEGVSAAGTTNPLPALEMALKLHPQLMYFLTDAADFPDSKAVIEMIRKYNPGRAIRINPILFVEDQSEHLKNQESESLMKQIAVENGGRFRWVEMDSLTR